MTNNKIHKINIVLAHNLPIHLLLLLVSLSYLGI